MTADTVTLDEALSLLSLPRVVGVDPEGREITALNGRYGPYLSKSTDGDGDGAKPDSRSLEGEEQLFTITLEQAEALFAQPKQRRGRATKPPIAELGPHPESGVAVRVLDGRFGPYVTDGTINATVPRGVQPEEVDIEQAVDLLAERAARGPAKKATRKGTRKKAPPKTTTRVVKKGTSKRAKAAKKKAEKKAEKKTAASVPANDE